MQNFEEGVQLSQGVQTSLRRMRTPAGSGHDYHQLSLVSNLRQNRGYQSVLILNVSLHFPLTITIDKGQYMNNCDQTAHNLVEKYHVIHLKIYRVSKGAHIID